MSERRAGIFFSYLNILLHAVIGFLYVPLLLHFIGKNEYGLYQLMGSFIACFEVMDFGLSASVVRFYARYRARGDAAGAENILAFALRGYAAITALLLAAGGVLYFFLADIFAGSLSAAELAEAENIFLLLLFNVAISFSTTPFRAVIQAEERFIFLKGMETVQHLLQPLVVILLLMAHPSAFSVALAQTGLNAVLAALHVEFAFRRLHVRSRYRGMDGALLRDFARLALAIFAVAVVDQVFWRTNQVILGIVSGTAAVAVYSIASIVYMNYMHLSTAISGVYLPHVSQMAARGEPAEAFSALFIQIGRWQYHLLALVATGFIIFGREFITLWAGPDFSDAYVMALLVILPFTIALIQNIGLSILQAMNRYDFVAKLYLAVGILNLALAIPLAKIYGGTGCAFATGLSMFIGNGLIMNWFYAKKIGLAIGRFWKEIGAITIPAAAVGVLGYVANVFLPAGGALIFGSKVVVYTAVYGMVMYVFAFNEDEKNKIRGILKISNEQ